MLCYYLVQGIRHAVLWHHTACLYCTLLLMLIVLEPVVTYFASALAQAYGLSVVYLHTVPQMRGTGMAPEEVP